MQPVTGLSNNGTASGGSAPVLPLQRCAVVGGELASQAGPLLEIGEQFSGHLDSAGEELGEQFGRGYALGPGSRGLRREAVSPAGPGDKLGGALACGPLVYTGPDPVELPSRHSAALAVLTWARVTRFPDNSTTWSKPSDRSAAA